MGSTGSPVGLAWFLRMGSCTVSGMKQSQEPGGLREGRFGVLTVLLTCPMLSSGGEQEAGTIPRTLANINSIEKTPKCGPARWLNELRHSLPSLAN